MRLSIPPALGLVLLIAQALSGVHGQVAVTSVESPDPCQCTELGISGGVPVQGKVGCLPDDTNPGSFFCYVVDPLGCPIASQSVVYQGAGYRTCEPTIEANSTSFGSVLDVLATVPSLGLFNTTVSTLGLASQLSALPNGVTIFAPNDDAINMFLSIFNWTATEALQSGELAPVLLFHIVPEIVPGWLIASQSSPSSLQTLSPAAYNSITVGQSSVLNVSAGSVVSVEPVLAVAEPVFDTSSPELLGIPTGFGALVLKSYTAGDGVVHVIDHVLEYPPNVLQLLSEEPDLSTFVAALNVTGIGAQLDPGCPDINQVDCNPNPITLFAPTNTAFANLASQLGTTPAGLLELPQLTDIVLNHITDPTQLTVPLAATDGDLDNAVIPVLNGATLVSGIQQTVIPIAPPPAAEAAPVAEAAPASEAAPTSEPNTETLDAALAALLGINAPPGASTVVVDLVSQDIVLTGSQNAAIVLPDYTLKGYNGAINGIDTVLLPPAFSVPVPPPAAESPKAELTVPAPSAEGAPAAEPVIVEPVNL